METGEILRTVMIAAGVLVLMETVLSSQYISETGTVVIIITALCLVWCLFFISVHISVLSRKTQELAMQVSLLNQENERILAELEQLREKEESDRGDGCI